MGRGFGSARLNSISNPISNLFLSLALPPFVVSDGNGKH